MTEHNQPQVILTKLNESFLKIQTSEQYMDIEIQEKFSFEVPNARFDPRVKAGRWDGIKRLYNRRSRTFPIGLLFKLVKFLKGQGYTYQIDPDLITVSDISRQDIISVVDEVIDPHAKGKQIRPYEHQYDALEHMLKNGRSLCLSSTSSGKSLIIYSAIRILQLTPEMEGKRIFVVVPSAYLVEQMFNDFKDYSTGAVNKWNVDSHCQKVNKDYKKWIDKQVVITTWQSMSKLPRSVLDQAGAMFIDECHGTKSDVLTKLINDSDKCPIKHGLTGSLDGFESNEMFIEGMFGPRKVIMSARDSIDKDIAAPLEIRMMLLKYDHVTRKGCSEVVKYNKDGSKRHPKNAYKAEKEFLYLNEDRKKFIVNLTESLDGNTLILVDAVESYQTPLQELFEQRGIDVHVINQNVPNSVREAIKQKMEAGEDKVVVLATFGTMSTGVSINNMNNLILGSSTKSVIRIVQSLGRMMRKHKNKKLAYVYDIVDDMSMGKNENYMLKHGQQRVKIYSDEKHKVKFFPIEFDENKLM